MPFGQIVIGPPGSGKSTYCAGMLQFFEAIGRRVAVVNLDPAADPIAGAPPPAVDVQDLVSLDSVQQELGLGPNGGLIYCIEYLEANLDWLRAQLAPLEADDTFILFDFPGQVELFTLHPGMKRLIDTLAGKDWNYRLVAVHCVDAHLCMDASKYMAALVLALSTMLHLELPQINVLTKFDLAGQYRGGDDDDAAASPKTTKTTTPFLISRGVTDAAELAEAVQSSLAPRFARLSRELCSVVDDFGLVHFVPLTIEDRESCAHVVALADKANGFAYRGVEQGSLPLALQGGDTEDAWQRMIERYFGRNSDDECEECGTVACTRHAAAAAPGARGNALPLPPVIEHEAEGDDL